MTRFASLVTLTTAFLILIVTASCRRDPYKVNLTGIEVEVDIRDLAGDIFGTPPNEMADRAETLKQEYGSALETYSTVIGLGDPSDERWKSAFILFATDLRNLDLYDNVKRVWPETDGLREELTDAFRHYRYYFPGRIVPEVISCISVFNNSIIVDDSLLMVSLDRYLGADSEYYPSLGIYSYQARKMTPAYTASDCIYAWAATEWDYSLAGYGTKNLLNSMLHEGKLVYFTRRMMPSLPDTILFGFTGEQLDFCVAGEGLMWEYLVSRDLLFSTDAFLIRKFTGESPFTSYFTEESPGRAVVWTGFRIIERFMNNNPDVTMEQLMAMTDCQAILGGAKYKPK
ncbi:MAG: hypothetical protein H6545_03730 [Bacteroidales bacterium]|jgi:hypothetical protein|nr:hypothetical protein [Bacteroidales bacterium]MDD3735797.1 hypothetical protein [Bacteroidales bacterium]NLD64624.1 hypothetical protein [Bacteroidales bacterium]HNT92648.1 hypothetical protein [Bacteroidales bacterium]HOO65772.1 hypothetical protein [Bacteroidales bacterium]